MYDSCYNNADKVKTADLLLNKYVREEIMTKSDFLDTQKEMLAGFKEQTRWVIGVVIATGIGLASLIVTLHYN